MPNTDFNGDGRDDILWRDRDTGMVGNWLASPAGGFTSNAANSLVGVPGVWTIVATGDFDGDGHDDILWYNSVTHQIGSWLGQYNGGYVVNPAGFDNIGSAVVLGTGDFDRNGQDDLLLLGSDGQDVDILLAFGDGFFIEAEIFMPIVPEDWNFVGIGDFNGDSRADILWRQDDGTIVTRLAHPGFGVSGRSFVANAQGPIQVPNDWQIVGIGDFNGDGHDDLLWRHDSGLLGNWLGGNGGSFSINNDSLIGVPLDWRVVATGDYDGDGRDDILWRNSVSGAIGTWHGTDSGIFTISPEPLVHVSTNWLVQPNPSGAGEWDY